MSGRNDMRGAPAELTTDAAELRERFEALASDPSYKFKRSRKGTYVNGAVARDWKWFQLGTKNARSAA